MRTRALWALLSMVVVGACGSREADCPEVPASPEPAAVTAPAEPAPAAEPGSDVAAAPRVVAGTCDTSWLPEGTARELSDEEEASLARAVREWLSNEGFGVVPGRGGIVFAKSEDDRGDEPPYPPEASPVAARACGLGASWLLEHLQARLAIPAGPDGEGVTCDENVCCFAGMEFVPHGTIVFGRDPERDLWTVEAALLVNEATLSEEVVARNRGVVASALTRLGSVSCEGEPLLAR